LALTAQASIDGQSANKSNAKVCKSFQYTKYFLQRVPLAAPIFSSNRRKV
jgi:hypothetical protein